MKNMKPNKKKIAIKKAEFSHSRNLDVHHPLLNMGTKSTHFINDGMIAWSQLEALNFNLKVTLNKKQMNWEMDILIQHFRK